jgi:thiamine pyrophosphokinase
LSRRPDVPQPAEAVSRAIVVADGDVPARDALDRAWPGWDDGVRLVIAADGGARGAEALGLRIDLIVGDGDSLGEAHIARFEAAGVPIRRVAAAKDESDTELAVLAALELGAGALAIVGGFGGGRFDHALANIGLLGLPALAGRPCVLIDATTRATLLSGPASGVFDGRIGDLVSLLALGDGVVGVTTEGLAYPLRDEPLPFGPARGLSNVRLASSARVELRSGRLLVVETPATLPT